MTLRSHHHPATTNAVSQAAPSATAALRVARASRVVRCRRHSTTYTIATHGTSTVPNAFVSSAAASASPTKTAVRRLRSPRSTPARKNARTAAHRSNSASFVIVEPEWSSCGMARGTSDAAIATGSVAPMRRAVAQAISGSGSTMSTLRRRSIDHSRSSGGRSVPGRTNRSTRTAMDAMR